MATQRKNETKKEFLHRVRIAQAVYRKNNQEEINRKQREAWNANLTENNEKQRLRYHNLSPTKKKERINYIVEQGRTRKNKLKQQIRKYIDMKCSNCGYDKCEEALDFHHKDPTQKEYNVSRMIGRGITFEQIKKEIDKCIILCANCHRELHKKSGLRSTIIKMEGL